MDAVLLMSLTGALFAFAIFVLYRVFQIGPIRFVAPIIGVYPVFSVLWAAFSGVEILFSDWVAVPVV